VRTLFEEVTLLAWVGLPDDPEQQRKRAIRVALAVYRAARDRKYELPREAKQLLKNVRGRAATKPPSMKDRAVQLDASERSGSGGQEFWVSHISHADMLSDIVHPRFLGPDFTDPMTRELLGFEAVVYGHQYLSLGIVSAARLSDQNRLADRAKAAIERIHETETKELNRLLKK
jgi:hypothetical protein